MSVQQVDTDPSLKNVPMMTADEVEIKLNSVLYRPYWTSGYSFKGEAKGEIEALRVYFVNNTHRQFRARCIRGCETVFKMSEGCSTEKLFGKLENAIESLVEKASHDTAKCLAKEEKIEQTYRVIQNEIKKVKSLRVRDLKIPKEVLVK